MSSEPTANELEEVDEASLQVTGETKPLKPVPEGEKHPVYKFFEDDANQDAINKKIKDAGYQVKKDEEGNVGLSSDSGDRITIDPRTGAYSGSTIDFKDCDPKNDLSVKKMGDQLLAIARAHKSSPDAGKPFDLDVDLHGAENLPEEDRKRIEEYKEEVRKYVDKNLSPEEKKNLTFGEQNISTPRTQATQQAQATPPAPSTTPTPQPTPSSTPRNQNEEAQKMNATAYFDKNNHLQYMHVQDGPAKGWYFNQSNYGQPAGTMAQKMDAAPDVNFDDKIQQGEYRKTDFQYTPQEQTGRVLSEQADTAVENQVRREREMAANTTIQNINRTVESQAHVTSEMKSDDFNRNLEMGNLNNQILNNAQMGRQLENEGKQHGGFTNFQMGTNGQTNASYATLTNPQNGNQISLRSDGSMAGSPAPSNANDEQKAKHHANSCLGMLNAMRNLGQDPINANFNFPGMPPQLQGLIQGQLTQMLNDPMMKMLFNMIGQINFDGKPIHENPKVKEEAKERQKARLERDDEQQRLEKEKGEEKKHEKAISGKEKDKKTPELKASSSGGHREEEKEKEEKKKKDEHSRARSGSQLKPTSGRGGKN